MQKFTAWQEVIKNNTITPLQLFRRFCLLGKASWESVPLIWYITDSLSLSLSQKKITVKFIFQISIHQNIIIATSLAKPAYETSIVRCVPEVAKDREIHNLFWKPSGSLIAFLFRTNKKLDIIIHNIQQLHNYFLFIWTMVLCLDNEFNRISKLYDSMESL